MDFAPIDPLAAMSTIAGYNMTSKGQKEANWSNAQQAHDARIWAEQMRATAHQSTVADLRKAGLNPILSASHGVNPTPSSTAARMESSGATAAQAGRELAHQSAMIRNLKEQNDQIKADTALKGQQVWQSRAEAEARLRQSELDIQRRATEIENTRAAKQTADILTSDAKGRALEGEIDETKFGEIMRYIDRAMRGLTGGSSALRNLKDLGGLGRGGSEAPARREPRLRLPPGF